MRARQLWGNEIYTQDSDLVAVLMHLGYYNHVIAAPPVNALEVGNQLGMPLTALDYVGLLLAMEGPYTCPHSMLRIMRNHINLAHCQMSSGKHAWLS